MGGAEGNEMKVKILTQMPITPLNILQFSGMKVKILTQMPITPLYILQIFKNESYISNVIIKIIAFNSFSWYSQTKLLTFNSFLLIYFKTSKQNSLVSFHLIQFHSL